MDFSKRLSDYDLFAHVTQGLIGLGGWDLLTGSHLVLSASWKLSDGLVVLIAAYILGQVLASPAALLLERGLARGLIGDVTALLMADRAQGTWRCKLFPEYSRPLPRRMREGVLARLGLQTFVPTDASGLFQELYRSARRTVDSAARLSTFLNLYGFCRNTAFLLALLSIAFAIRSAVRAAAGCVRYDIVEAELIIATGVAAVVLFYRFLKYHRLFTIEALLAPKPD